MSSEFMPDHEKAARAFMNAAEKHIKDNFPSIIVSVNNFTDMLLDASLEQAEKNKGTEVEEAAIKYGDIIDIESAKEIAVTVFLLGDDHQEIERASSEIDAIAEKYNGEFVDYNSLKVEGSEDRLVNVSLYGFS